MKSVLLRTGSVPICHHHHSFSTASHRVSFCLLHDSAAEERRSSWSRNVPIRFEINRRPIVRSSSDSEMISSQIDSHGGVTRSSSVASMFVNAGVEEETHALEEDFSVSEVGSLSTSGDWPMSGIAVEEECSSGVEEETHALEEDFSVSQVGSLSTSGDWPMSGIAVEEECSSGGGGGDEWRSTSRLTGGNSDRSKMSEYYQEMLKVDPMNPLLLRNYGKFLHEVEGSMKKAVEYYERAILANPGDGEVLSMYAQLIWRLERNEERTNSYFDQAVQASPNDCMVLGSYAHFMWETEDNEDETELGTATVNSLAAQAF